MVAKLPIVLCTNTLGSEELRATDTLSAGSNRITEVATPVEGTDAVNMDYVSSFVTNTNHGTLLNLLNDDHPQYHNNSRAATWLASQDQSLGDNKIIDLAPPVNGTDAVNLDFLTEAITEVIYNADSITLNTGNYVSGDVDSVSTLSDGDSYIVDEVAGVPGFDIEFNFSGITSFSRVWLHALYLPGSHTIDLDIWNYNTLSWDTIDTFTSTGDFIFIEVPIDSNNYINSGESILRLYHPDNGNPSHDIIVDYIALAKAGFGSSNEHGSLLGLADDDHPQYLTEARYNALDYPIPAGTTDPLGATGHWLLAWDDPTGVEWFWSYELPDFSGATEKDVLRITALNTLEWAARGVNLTSTYMLFANADTEIAGTDKLIFDGTDFTLAAGSSIIGTDFTDGYILYADTNKKIQAYSLIQYNSTRPYFPNGLNCGFDPITGSSNAQITSMWWERTANPFVGWLLDYQDMLYYAGSRGTVTATPAPDSGNAASLFIDDTNSISYNNGTSPGPIVIEIIPTTAIPHGGSAATWAIGLTFRSNTTSSNPTNIKIELDSAGSYYTVYDGNPGTIGIQNQWISPSFSTLTPYTISKIKLTLTNTNPLPNTFRLQRCILYHVTATWDNFHLHIGGGTLFGNLTLSTGASFIGTDFTSTYMFYADANKKIAATSKLTFDGTDFTIASGSSLKSITGSDLVLNAAAGQNIVLDGMKFPNADGTNGDVLTTDGAGNLSWVAP